MTLEEAIDELDEYLTGIPMDYRHKFRDSVRLGFEAMKLTKRLRKEQGNEYLLLLPGETQK